MRTATWWLDLPSGGGRELLTGEVIAEEMSPEELAGGLWRHLPVQSEADNPHIAARRDAVVGEYPIQGQPLTSRPGGRELLTGEVIAETAPEELARRLRRHLGDQSNLDAAGG